MTTPSEAFDFTLDQLTFVAFFTLLERADDRLVVGLWLIPLTYGVLVNATLLATVLGCKELRENPSYYALNHIALCSASSRRVFVLLASSSDKLTSEVHSELAPNSPLNYTISFVAQCVWWAFVFELTFVAFTRFKLFARRVMLAVVGVTTSMGITMCAPHMHACCRILWLFDDWTNTYYPTTTWYIQFDFVVTLTTIGIIIVSYAGVFWRLRESAEIFQTSTNKGRDQRKIALQVGLMCVVYIINSILWNVIPYIAASKWVNVAFVSTTSIQCGIHPTIAFAFNRRIRKELSAKMRSTIRRPPRTTPYTTTPSL
ncbi:hypothetical protein PRIPAC_96019, partial [Pristionchus pacificus]|uniref:G protein-coupled receptor n=1 Tax=Pristionchus pacificus TaxID=54126 RepID=A0A2A6D2N8_PRIPA